jgi:hypothetical protein
MTEKYLDRAILAWERQEDFMDERFRGYFRGRMRAYEGFLAGRRALPLRRPQEPLSRDAVQAGLEAARREAAANGFELREDAQLLIALLAQELVARPVATVTPEDAEQLPGILEDDIGTIVRQAAETANDGEVSAHAVIDGLSSSWDRLRSSNLRVWDRHASATGRAESEGLGPGV